MKVLLSWIREFVDVPGTPEAIGERMSMRGLALEGIERLGDDAVLDFDVTANRPDCLSIRGIAREIAVAHRLPLKSGGAAAAELIGRAKARPLTSPETRDLSAAPQKSMRAPALAGVTAIPITIEEPELCRRYVGALADVTIGPSPDWLQSRLTACGQRPINNIVDITNYVLLELGQPLHAFDLARLRGPAIVVRRARPGETITTLDGKARLLDPEMLVIADAERASAIGGVMGGADSEVSAQTTQIVFESAWFKAQSVRRTSKRLGLRTEASYRFERGADLTGQAEAIERALALLAATGAGQRRGSIIDVYPAPYDPRSLMLQAPAIEQLLGMRVPDEETERILQGLGFDVRTLGGWNAGAPEAAAPMSQAGQGWQVEVPGWRPDVLRSVDLIEEVGRQYGFEHLPTTFPAVEESPAPSDPRIARDHRVRTGLLAMGLSEAITFAFIDASMAAPFAGTTAPLALANPLSEKFTTLRPSLLPGLVDAVSHNRRHGQRDVRLFEIGTRFANDGETRAAAGVWTGTATPDHWSGSRRDVDFFDVKGAVAELCALMDVNPRFEVAGPPYLVEGRRAEIWADAVPIGTLGQLDPLIAEQRDLPSGDAVYLFELNLDRMTAHVPHGARLARPLPRHPSVVRDVSIIVGDTLSAETVRGTIRAANVATLVDIREFDRYQGKGIPDSKVSLSLRLTFQAPDRTLTDNEIHIAMDAIVGALTRDLGASQR